MSDTAMTAKFYSFSKRNRSTKVVDTTPVEKSIYLKDATTVIRPVIIVQTIEAVSYNYVYLVNWNRYYFVSDWMYVKGRWEISLILDPLATYKTNILLTSCNILYASGSTKHIPDSRIPVRSNLIQTAVSGQDFNISDMTIVDDGGMVVLGITGKGSFGPYLMQNSNQLPELLDGLDSWMLAIVDQMALTQQLLYGGSASECLRSAVRIPVIFGGANVSTKSQEPLYLGNYPCKDSGGIPIYGYEIDKPILIKETDVSIPWPYLDQDDWRRLSSYTNIIIYLPFIGNIQIPATEAHYDTKLHIRYAINVTSGDTAVQVKGYDSKIIFANCNSNIAIPTAYGSTGIDTTKATQAVVAGVGAVVAGVASMIASGGATAPAVLGIGAGLASAAGGTLSAMGGSGSGSGGLGGGAAPGLDKVGHIFVTSKILSDTPANFDPIMGKPYFGVSTPGSFTGYVQTDGFQYSDAAASSEEKDMINSLMDGGVYIE